MMDHLEAIVQQLNASQIAALKGMILDRELMLGTGKYSSAKVYNVIHEETGVIAYTGSTIKELQHRWAGHRSFFKSCPNAKWSQYVAEHGGPGRFQIQLIRNCPCKTLPELLEIERQCIDFFRPVCNIMLTGLKYTEAKWEKLTGKLLYNSQNSRRLQMDCVFLCYRVFRGMTDIEEDSVRKILEEPNMKRILFNCLTELHAPLEHTRFAESMPKRNRLICVNTLCRFLGLKHCNDTAQSISYKTLEDNHDAIASVVEEYQLAFAVRDSTAGRTIQVNSTKQPKNRVQILRLRINTVLKDFAGTSLTGKYSQSRTDGRVKHWFYIIKPEIANVNQIIKSFINGHNQKAITHRSLENG